MKYLKITGIIFIIALLLEIFASVNLKVSYKYEVDLMETHVKVSEMPNTSKAKEYARIEKVKERIKRQQKTVNILFWIFLIGLIIILLLILYISNNKK